MSKRVQTELPKDAVRQYTKAIVCAVCHKPAIRRGQFAVGKFRQPGKGGQDCDILEYLCKRHADMLDRDWPGKIAARTTRRFNPHSRTHLQEQQLAGQSSYLVDPLNKSGRTEWQAQTYLTGQPIKLWQPAGLMLPAHVPTPTRSTRFARRRACYARHGGCPEDTYAGLAWGKMILYGDGMIALPATSALAPAPDTYKLEHQGQWTWVYFPTPPDPTIRARLKAAGFRWSVKRMGWYARKPITAQAVGALIAGRPAQTARPVYYPAPALVMHSASVL